MNRTQKKGRGGSPGPVNRFYRATAALATGVIYSAVALLTACSAAAEYRGPAVYGGSGGDQNAPADKAYYVTAPVLSVTPITVLREVERPVQHCTEYERDTRREHRHERREQRYENREHRKERRTGPSLVGGLIGGLIGSQFGGGTGRKVLTVIGALAGSSIANGIDRDRRREHDYDTPRRTCRTTYEYDTVEETEGYEVVYEYGGQEFLKTVPSHPGDRIRVRVELSPVVDG